VIATTFTGLAHLQVDLPHIDLLVVLDAVTAIARSNRIAIESAESARLIGLVDIGTPLSPWERDWIAAYFGARSLTLLKHGRQPLTIGVLFESVVGGPIVPLALNATEMRRRAIWQAPMRNRRIAAVARRLSGCGSLRNGSGWVVLLFSWALRACTNRMFHCSRPQTACRTHIDNVCIPGWPPAGMG
jgi:hypothetical protein